MTLDAVAFNTTTGVSLPRPIGQCPKETRWKAHIRVILAVVILTALGLVVGYNVTHLQSARKDGIVTAGLLLNRGGNFTDFFGNDTGRSSKVGIVLWLPVDVG